jgi:hypothetical protein
LAGERDNLLAAVNHAVDTAEVDLGLRIVGQTAAHGLQTGFAVLLPIAAVVELPGAANHDLYPYALARSAMSAVSRGDLNQAEEFCHEALNAARRLTSEHEQHRVEHVVAGARHARMVALGQWRESADYAEQVASMARDLGMGAGAAAYLSFAATAHTMAGDPLAGVDRATEAVDLARAVGAPTVIGMCLMALASTLAATEPDQARRLLQEVLAQLASFDIDSLGEAGARPGPPREFPVAYQGALVAAQIGDWLLSLQLADRSIRLLQWGGQWSVLAGILNVVARALAPTDVEAAARLQGAARHLAVQIGTRLATAVRNTGPGSFAVRPAGSSLITDLRRQTSQLLDDGLDELQLQQLRAEGEAMDSDQAVLYALEAIRRARQPTAL